MVFSWLMPRAYGRLFILQRGNSTGFFTASDPEDQSKQATSTFMGSDPNGGSFSRSDDWVLCRFQLICRPSRQVSAKKRNLVARLPWANNSTHHI
jgi:hypothetical protein